MDLKDMARAHMGNVQVALSDLYKQKQKIEEEIVKITNYLNEAQALLDSTESSSDEVNVPE
jgi:predicted  nucleic acid-binding Zn-ribbon protein